MSRSNDGLPMLPPWLSESEVGQSGYEAPVQNLPHEELIEETPGRRRGRFKNRAPEADRPDAARPEKRRKGWRRDKHEGAADEEQRQSEASHAPAPVPDEPVPAQLPPESWQHPGYDRTPPAQDNSWQAPPQRDHIPQRDNTPQHSLPTRNPAQPSPGFQPLGSRAADAPVSNDQPTHRQSERPDLPPPPPRQSADERPGRAPNDEPVSPSRGESAQVSGGRPPLGPQNGGWPSTGNPRLDAALSAVRPSQWPASTPPGQAAAAPVSPVEPAQPGGEPRKTPQAGSPTRAAPTGNQPTAPTSADPSAPPSKGGYPSAPDPAAWQSGYSSAPTSAQPTPPHGGYPAAPPLAPDPAWQRGHSPMPTSAQPTPPPTVDPAMPPTGDSPAEPAHDHTAAVPSSSAPPAQHPTTSSGGSTPGASDTTPPIEAHQTLPGDRQVPAPQAAQAGPTAVTPDGPPPWLAAPQPAQTEASATDTPRRLPPLPDPPAPHERPHSGGSGTPATAPARDEHRPTRGTDGPPPWLGHTASEQTGRPSRPGLPPAPNETAAQAGSAPSEPHLPADSPPSSHQVPADHAATEPFLAASATVPHAEQGGAVPVSPTARSVSAIGVTPVSAPAPGTAAQPDPAGLVNTTRVQGDPGASAPSWTSATETGPASMRPVAGGGRHRLSAESNDPSAPHAPVEQAPIVDQQPVPQHQPETAHGAGGPHAVPAGVPTQFASGQAPGLPPQAPAAQWGNAAAPAPAPESGSVGPHSAPPQYHPEHQAAGQPIPQPGQWGTPPGYAQPPGAPFQQPSLDNVPLRRAKKAPGSGWRKAVHHVSGGSINPGMSAEERRLQELVARIRQPVRGDYRIAVLSLKGGVGKTTTTMGIGSIFASIRGDRVIAVDANPDFGTLSQRVPLQTRSTVRDLLLDSSIQRYSDVRRHTSQATSRLEVLASERDPAASEAFSEDEYRAVARILQRFYNIILTDCGTGLMHSAMAGVLDLAHSLVLISSPAIDGARSAAATLDWLSLHGHDHLVRNAVVVINSPRAGSPNVGIQQLREYFLSRCRAVHIIPFDPHMSEGAEIDLHRLHKQTKRAYVELAATVADDFATDHRRYQP